MDDLFSSSNFKNVDVQAPYRIFMQPTSTRGDDWKFEVIGNINTCLNNLLNKVDDIQKAISKNNNSILIYDLDSEHFSLPQPLSVIISKDQDEYIAESIDFDIYGVGEDEKIATLDLKNELINYYQELELSSDNLSIKLIKKFQLMKKLIKHENS